jgi:Na+/pantothenate symporter
LITGCAIGGTLIAILSGPLIAVWIENLILSSLTWAAFAFILYGYFYKKDGQKTAMTDILLGVGIGITLAWFVGAGNGTLSLSDITF